MDDLFETRRYDFLKTMYSEMWGNVNRHLTVIWQSVSVLGGALAVFSLVEKNVVNIDVASAIVVIICSWLVANAYITNAWFNRNQAIISNIERQFLRREDLKVIHPYFMSRRPVGKMVEHIQLQRVLGIFLGVGVLIGDFVLEVWPYIHHLCSLELRHVLPYLVAILGAIGVLYFRAKSLEGERKFLADCPIVQSRPEQNPHDTLA
jgi:hypothetical protein